MHGFADFVARLLNQTDIRFITFAFDPEAKPSLRQGLLPEYKSSRSATPEKLRHQFSLCRELLNAMGIVSVCVPDYEADDVIYTLATRARAAQKTVCVISGDKDLVQCIDVNDVYWDWASGQKMNARTVEKRFGIKPQQFADLLALSGDKADDIPGVRGIGTTTAARLLRKWGNLDILFEHLDEAGQMRFRGAAAVAQLLQSSEQQVRRARQVTGLYTIKHLQLDSAAMARQSYSQNTLEQFLVLHDFSESQQRQLFAALQH